MPEYTPEQIEGQGYKNTTQDIIDLLKSSVDLQTTTMLGYEEAETLLSALSTAEDQLKRYEWVLAETEALVMSHEGHIAKLDARLQGAAERAVEWCDENMNDTNDITNPPRFDEYDAVELRAAILGEKKE